LEPVKDFPSPKVAVENPAPIPPHLTTEKILVTTVTIILMLTVSLTPYFVFMALEKTALKVLSVLAITAITAFVYSRFEKKWKKAEGDEASS